MWAPQPPIFDGWSAAADNLSARRKGHAGFLIVMLLFSSFA